MKEYSPTIMPEEVTAFWGSGHHNWTKKQRETYFKWYLDILGWRVQRLLDYFDEDLSGTPGEILDRLGNKIAEVLPDSYFTYEDDDGKRRLTNRGYDLAADMGLLVAKMILDACSPQVHWKTETRKSHLSANFPVLTGLGPIDLEPIRVAITNMIAIANETESPNFWKRLYLHNKQRGAN